MSFKGETRWTQRVWARVDSAIRKEASVVAVANGALHLISGIKQTDEAQPGAAEALQEFPWYIADKEGNQFFHSRQR